ncbi:vacuolar sorting protein VPS52 [Cryptosporidium canis]|uniref:Vacuolar sorting protein VPS52 n=1 Tax=Cryptosporidium canis TaxID=195482 RepID=A0A9D5DHV0_9CRYT|nr:vacuolar sorting protein VPS52 [Cryptosporidium canis]
MKSNALIESSSYWFLHNYEHLTQESKHMCGLSSNPAVELKYNEQLNDMVLRYGDKIVELDRCNSLFINHLSSIYDLFLILLERISECCIKVDAIKHGFIILQSRLNALSQLHGKVRGFISKTLVCPNLINKIKYGELNWDYCPSLMCLLERYDSLQNICAKRTNIECELNLLYGSLIRVAVTRLKHDISLIFSTNESVLILLRADFSKSKVHSELMKRSQIIKFLMSNTTELNFFQEEYINFANCWFSKVLEKIEELCGNKEHDILITSKEYDKYSSLIFEREKILDNFYMMISEPIKDKSFSDSNVFRMEDIFFYSQKMIYMAFISIYEQSKQLFSDSLKYILFQIFNEHFIKISNMFQLSILRTNDTIGLAIVYNILLRFNCLSESKLKVFSNAIVDSYVLFEYYEKQIRSIYASLETSVLYHLSSLSSLSGRELIKVCISDKLSHINPITRRVSDLLIILSKLLDESNVHGNNVMKLISIVKTFLTSWLELSNSLLQSECNMGDEEGYVFIINNADFIISALNGKTGVLVDDFQIIFCEYIHKYIESRFIRAYPDIQKVIDLDISLDEMDSQYIIEIFECFSDNWKEKIDIETQAILTSFSNFNTSEEVLRLLGTTIAVKYSKFVNIVKTKLGEKTLFEKNKIGIEEILNYIQTRLHPVDQRIQ